MASFKDILSVRQPTTMEEATQFTDVLATILERHSGVLPTMARGVLIIKKQMTEEGQQVLKKCPFLQDFLDRFYMSRIMLRMLIQQQIAMTDPQPGYVGSFAVHANPIDIAEDAIADASRICEKEFGFAPDVNITCDDTEHSIQYVVAHLHHMLFELLKNSMRAVVEKYGANNYDMPDIEMYIAEGPTDFTIKISDQGGGLSRDEMGQVWSYLHTTATRPIDEDALATNSFINAPMAGFGYGLPVARLYARSFGGDLQLVSTPGYGVDAYIYLNKLHDSELFIVR